MDSLFIIVLLVLAGAAFLVLFQTHKTLTKIRSQVKPYSPAKAIIIDIEETLFVEAVDPMNQNYVLSHDGSKQLVPIYDVDTLQQIYDVLQDHLT